jgi:hypothetical protein
MLNDVRVLFRSFSSACGGLRGKFFLRKNLMPLKSTLTSLANRLISETCGREDSFGKHNVWI